MYLMLDESNESFPYLEYFTPHLGEYINVLSALEKLNVAILKAMDKTKEVGDDGVTSALCSLLKVLTDYENNNSVQKCVCKHSNFLVFSSVLTEVCVISMLLEFYTNCPA